MTKPEDNNSPVSEKEISRKPMRILISGFIFSILILAAFSIISFIQIRKDRIVSDWIIHSFTVKLKMREGMEHLINAQSQHRAFLLTSDSLFYKSFRSSLAAQKLINDQLDSLEKEYKEQSINLKDFKQLSQRRSGHMEKVLDSATVRGPAGVTPMLIAGAKIMDSLTVLEQRMEKAEDEHLKFRLIQKDTRERKISGWMLGFSIIALITIVVSFLILRTQRYRLSKAHINKLYLEMQVQERTKEISLANSKLQEQNIELSARNAELKNFAFISSHDMREPLRKIQTFLKLILETEGENLSSESRKYADGILASGRRMTKLLDAILVYMTVSDKKKKEPVDLNSVMEQTLHNQKKYIDEKDASVDYNDLPTIYGIPDQLVSLFCTFVSNSIKFSNGKPVIKVTASSDTVNDQPVWKIEFSDNGIGFNMDYSEKIFQIFQKLHSKDEYPGTGLGLALAKKIVHNHGGTIAVHSEINKGSTFTVFFPKVEGVVLAHHIPLTN